MIHFKIDNSYFNNSKTKMNWVWTKKCYLQYHLQKGHYNKIWTLTVKKYSIQQGAVECYIKQCIYVGNGTEVSDNH